MPTTAPTLLRLSLLASVALAPPLVTSSDGGNRDFRSPTAPASASTPTGTTAIAGANYAGDATVLSRNGAGGCGWGTHPGESRADVLWKVTISVGRDLRARLEESAGCDMVHTSVRAVPACRMLAGAARWGRRAAGYGLPHRAAVSIRLPHAPAAPSPRAARRRAPSTYDSGAARP